MASDQQPVRNSVSPAPRSPTNPSHSRDGSHSSIHDSQLIDRPSGSSLKRVQIYGFDGDDEDDDDDEAVRSRSSGKRRGSHFPIDTSPDPNSRSRTRSGPSDPSPTNSTSSLGIPFHYPTDEEAAGHVDWAEYARRRAHPEEMQRSSSQSSSKADLPRPGAAPPPRRHPLNQVLGLAVPHAPWLNVGRLRKAKVDSSDPDANFFKMDTWNADDEDDLADEQPGKASGLSLLGSGDRPNALAFPSGPVSSSGYLGSQGVGTRKDVILDGTGQPAMSPGCDEGKERTEWQSMLKSVMAGDILKGEKSRIGGEASSDQTYKRKIGTALWWEIRARLRGRTEKEERKRVQERRERTVDAILEEVERFKVVLPERFQTPESVPSLRKALRKGSGSSDAGKSSFAEALEQEEGAEDYALEQLLVMLSKLAHAESLYPNLATMREEKPLYASAAFQHKIEGMNAWVTMISRFRNALERLQRWTGSKDLDITSPDTTAERALVSRFRPQGSPNSAPQAVEVGADSSTFMERMLKEDTVTRTLNRMILIDLYSVINAAKDTILRFSDTYTGLLGLEVFETGVMNDLALLLNFPSRILVEAVRLRLDAINKLTDPSEEVVTEMTKNFRRTMSLIIATKDQYLSIMEQDPGKKWKLPECLADGFDEAVISILGAFFKLLHWTLKSGSKAIYFRETEVLENEWEFLYQVAETVEGGDVVVAENFCNLTNKLMIRVINYFDTQLRVPIPMKKGAAAPPVLDDRTAALARTFMPNSVVNLKTHAEGQREMTPDEMVIWFNKILDAVKMRYRKLQRFARRLTQRFDNSAEWDLRDVELDLLCESLEDAGHFMVYTQTFEAKGVYIIADASLKDRPELIRQLMYKSFSPMPQPSIRRRARARRINEELMRNGETDPDVLISSAGEISDPDVEDGDPAYLLALSPRRPFMWQGPILNMDLPWIDLKMSDERIRLVADGPANRLSMCRDWFIASFMHDDDLFLQLDCLVDQQAHLPSIQKQLRRIAKSTNRLSDAIIDSVGIVRAAVQSGPSTQDLLQNWYVFATDHGQRVGVHMDHKEWSRFSRKLMRLSIGWVSFITDMCDPSDRKTFRWAVNALEYAMLMTRGNNILHLEPAEFQLLREKVASCISLLISHFDILGAKSSFEAKKEADRLEAVRRLQRIQENMDDRYGTPVQSGERGAGGLSQRAKVDMLMKEVYGSDLALETGDGDRSARLMHQQRMEDLEKIEAKMETLAGEWRLVGQVIADSVSEDRSLVFLASLRSNIAIKWQQGDLIGEGANGKVFKGYNLDASGVMAVKEIRVKDLTNSPTLYKHIKEEADVMGMLSHPNIVAYYGIEVHRDRVYIFEEYCQGGSLADLLADGQGIEQQDVVISFALQMLSGLEYLHSKRVEHRDVKPENILLTEDHMTLKFVDFGASKILTQGNRTMAMAKSLARSTSDGDPNSQQAMKSLNGTPMYMAPEVIKNDRTGRLGACDIWSMGCCVMQMVTGKKPWSHLDNEWAIMFHIGISSESPPLPKPGEASEAAIDFIAASVTVSSKDRPTAVELLEHPWLAEVKAFLAANELGGYGYAQPASTNAIPVSVSGVSSRSAIKASSSAGSGFGAGYRAFVASNTGNVVKLNSGIDTSVLVEPKPDSRPYGREGVVRYANTVDEEMALMEEGFIELGAAEMQALEQNGQLNQHEWEHGQEEAQAEEANVGDIEWDPETGLEMYYDPESGRRWWNLDGEGEWISEGEARGGFAEAYALHMEEQALNGEGGGESLVPDETDLSEVNGEPQVSTDDMIEEDVGKPTTKGVRFG